jgi:anti-sigma B factor antagonist
MASVDPVRIPVDEERQAAALAQELIGVSDVDDWKRDGSTIAYGIRTERSGEDIVVVSLAGEHDLYTAPKVQEALRGVIAAGARITVVDLTETTFLDSTMLHVLLIARKELREGGRLLVVTNDASVKRVFEISGIDRFFDFFPSRCAVEEEVRSHEPDE